MPPARRLEPDPARPRPRPARLYAYTRAYKINSVQYLVAQGRHARREDRTGAARVREDAVPGTSLGWSFLDGPKPEPRPAHGSHYAAAHRAFLRARGARSRRGTPHGLHLQVNLSPGWIEEEGDLHDPANPRIRAHWDAAVAWARDAFGEALFALRIDLDETGGGVADAFLAPLRRLGHKVKAAAGRLWVSVNRAMEELTARFGHRKSENWHAINTAWAAYAHEHLDPRLKRGEPKRLTGRWNLSPDLLRSMHERLDIREAEITSRERQASYVRGAFNGVLRTALAGRPMGMTAAGVSRPGSDPGTLQERALTSDSDDHRLRNELNLLWPSHAPAIRASMGFAARLSLSVEQTGPAAEERVEGSRSQSDVDQSVHDEIDNLLALPDPFDTTPRPW